MKVFVVYIVISIKCFITMKVQEIESWNFACPNILKRCAWRPNFSHFWSETTKISMSKLTFTCPTWCSSDCNLNCKKSLFQCLFQLFQFRNDKDIDVQIDVRMSNLTFLRLYSVFSPFVVLTYSRRNVKLDTRTSIWTSISLSFLNWNGWNLVSRHIFSRCLGMPNFSSLSSLL